MAEKFGLGITTNPTLVLRDRSGQGLKGIILRLRNANVPEIFFHLEDYELAILNLLDPTKFVIKLSWLRDKYELATQFKRAGFRVCATAVYTPEQFLTAAVLGVDYVAFYFDRSKRKGFDPRDVLSHLMSLSQKFSGGPTLLVASLKELSQLMDAIETGATHFTLPIELFEQLFRDNEATVGDATEFRKDFVRLSQLNQDLQR